jgi:hypothetical protein
MANALPLTHGAAETVLDGTVEESAFSAVSWAAVIAGAAVASALAVSLVALGSGIGLVSISPWSNSGISATTFGLLAVAWFAAIQLFASGVGGYIAGRLRTRWVGVHTDEVFFRDTAHGLLVWAVGTIVSVGLLASAVSSVVSGAAQVGGAALHGAGSAVTAAAGAAAAKTDVTAYFTDKLFRTDHPPAQGDVATARSEVGLILAKSAADGDLNDADKAYVAQVVARQTGLSQADAEKRVADVVLQAKAAAAQAADTAKKAADEARKIGIYASLWAFISLLIGAFSASYMATVGGRLRDDLPAMG